MVEGFPQAHRMPRLHKLIGTTIPICTETPCAAREVPRTQEGAFFFTKKAYCGNQTLCVAENRKSVQT